MNITGEVLINMRADSTGVVDKTGNTWTIPTGIVASNEKTKYGNYSIKFPGTARIERDILSTEIIGSDDFTLAFWMYRISDVQGYTATFCFVRGTSGGLGELWIVSTNSLTGIEYENSGHELTSSSDKAVIKNGQWAYVVLTSDKMTRRLYVNGCLVLTDTYSSVYSVLDSNYTKFIFGQDYYSPGNTLYYGYIDDLVLIKGKCLWNTKYHPIPTTYLIDGGYLPGYNDDSILKLKQY